MSTHHLRADGTYVLGDYHAAAPFASFFPGIAGPWGRPLWVFYVNRGQAVACVGLRDKDHAILEFQPASKAYRLTPTHGFRTFIKRGTGARAVTYEPFRPHDKQARQTLHVAAAELQLEEQHPAHGLRTTVRYFTIPNEPVAALARVLTITNTTRRPQTLELLDGAPAIVPVGMEEWFLKHMSRTIEAWVTVTNLERRAPLFRLAVDAHDRPEVTPITDGNFYAAWLREGAACTRLPVVADAERVFGQTNDLATPAAFWSARAFRVPQRQIVANQMPCAFAHLRTTLAAGRSVEVVSLLGHVRHEQVLNDYLRRVDGRFIDDKAAENRAVVDALQGQALTVTASPVFDRYVQQTFLDNGLRGGFPVTLGPPDRRALLYLYGRKHGDLERDYNQFVLEPSPCSQGNANYRDVNQNRRSDGWIYPEAALANVTTFLNLLQLDGYNPLVYTGTRFRVTFTAALRQSLARWLSAEQCDGLAARLRQPVTAGELLLWLEDRGVTLGEARTGIVSALVAAAERVETADHGEGFWTDHWTYNLDLLENAAALFPDRLRTLLVGDRRCTWYDNTHVVVPRSERYVLTGSRVRQAKAVRKDAEKAALLARRSVDVTWVRIKQGQGDVYRSSVLAKLIVVALNKLASLDPAGVGIEMEADKPNWYDALNGLPALLGSSVSETCELIRWLRWITTTLDRLQVPAELTVALPVEAAGLLGCLREICRAYPKQPAGERDWQYWEQASTAKEQYRASVRLGVGGAERSVTIAELREFIALALERLSSAVPKARDATRGVYATYFWYEPVGYQSVESTSSAGRSVVHIRRFRQHVLPLFLEGNVHALRLLEPAAGRALHQAVTRSSLYDRPLGMYKVTESLVGQPLEIGRACVFTRGWLEHETVWLHMEYKYLLELLRLGLSEEFFAAFQRAGIPFQPPKRYGRSPLESSSFIVSSVYHDRALHGRGFVARLTGATAEFMEMWRLMMVGARPFVAAADGALTFSPAPQLPAWLFTKKPTTVTYQRRSGATETVTLPSRTVSCLLFGETLVTYHNARGRATFGRGAVRPVTTRCLVDGAWQEWSGGTVPAPYAARLRAGEVARLEIGLA